MTKAMSLLGYPAFLADVKARIAAARALIRKLVYIAHSSPEKLAQLVRESVTILRRVVAEIPWGQHLRTLNRIANPAARAALDQERE